MWLEGRLKISISAKFQKLVFQPSFRMKSGVEVKQQLIEEHSIFMYFPCSLYVLPTRKSA